MFMSVCRSVCMYVCTYVRKNVHPPVRLSHHIYRCKIVYLTGSLFCLSVSFVVSVCLYIIINMITMMMMVVVMMMIMIVVLL